MAEILDVDTGAMKTRCFLLCAAAVLLLAGCGAPEEAGGTSPGGAAHPIANKGSDTSGNLALAGPAASAVHAP